MNRLWTGTSCEKEQCQNYMHSNSAHVGIGSGVSELLKSRRACVASCNGHKMLHDTYQIMRVS